MRETRLIILLLLVLSPLAGCFNYRVGARERPEAVPLGADAWPSRDASTLGPVAEATPERIYGTLPAVPEDTVPFGTAEGTHHSSEAVPVLKIGDSVYLPEPAFTITASCLDAGGLLRVYERPSEARDSIEDFFETLFYGFERNATYVSSYWYERFGAATEAEAGERAEEIEASLAEGHADRVLFRPTPDELLLVGTNIALGIPAEAAGDRGIVVHLPALVGNEYEQGVVDRLERDGWTVLHVESDVRVRGPGYLERREAQRRRNQRRAEILEQRDDMPEISGTISRRGRMTIDLPPEERRRYEQITSEAWRQAASEIPLPDSGFEIRPDSDPEALGAVIAEYVDQHLADHAYAAEAGVAYLDETLPALSARPIVVIGFSAGSLVAPTVAARLREAYPGRVRAMVLVGSGAPVLDVARLSTLTDGGLELTPEGGPEPSDAQVEAVREAYLRAARLDPYATAPALRDLPILHVYADSDTIVPTGTARILNERLGDPDRLVYSGGHLGLFYFLPKERERIAGWVRRHAEGSP